MKLQLELNLAQIACVERALKYHRKAMVAMSNAKAATPEEASDARNEIAIIDTILHNNED